MGQAVNWGKNIVHLIVSQKKGSMNYLPFFSLFNFLFEELMFGRSRSCI